MRESVSCKKASIFSLFSRLMVVCKLSKCTFGLTASFAPWKFTVTTIFLALFFRVRGMTSVFTSELCFIIATSQKTNKTWAVLDIYYFAYAAICADVGLIPTVMMQILDGIAFL